MKHIFILKLYTKDQFEYHSQKQKIRNFIKKQIHFEIEFKHLI